MSSKNKQHIFSRVDVGSRAGFTIVELLIVIVVIGILAAISIVAYNGIQNRAHDVAVQNDLANLAKRFELFMADNSRYPNHHTDMNNLGLAISKDSYLVSSELDFNLIPCQVSGNQKFAIAAVSKSKKRFYVTDGSSVKEYTGGTAWLGVSNSYSPMCSSALAGSSVISSASGVNNGTWRPWTNG